ncbi:MAG: hypothetical protein PHW02_01625 [bacterium]|nr:hypothetical protein [bacterium]
MKKILLSVIVSLAALFLFSQNFDNYKIYLWDNDYGAVFVNPDDGQTNIGYEYNVKKALNKIGFADNVRLFEGDTMARQYTKLSQYGAVFIVTGHYPVDYRSAMFTTAEIDTLAKYLNWGGCVYFEGNNVMEFLKLNFPVFYSRYFNDSIEVVAQRYAIDSLMTDPTSSFCRYYRFNYPESSVSDSGVDFLVTRDGTLREPNYFKVLYFDNQSKLYKSTATAYTPPATKDGKYFYFPGKTFVQSVDVGAFSYQTYGRTERPLPDSIKSQYIRMAYLKDVLRFFGMARTLIVVDDGTTAINASIDNAMTRLANYDSIVVATQGAPIHANLMPYTSVFWYTDTMNTTLTLTDTLNLGVYLDYGGNLFLASDNFAEQYGANFPFLTKYLGSNFVDDSFPNDTIYASLQSFWYYNDVSDTFRITKPTRGYEPDVIRTDNSDADTAFYVLGSSRNKLCCGTRYSSITHNSIFLSFPFLRAPYQTKAGYPVDSILKIALKVYFDYDLDFETHDYTFSSECDIAFSVSEKSIFFYVTLKNPSNGEISVFRDGKRIAYKQTSSDISYYKIDAERLSGEYEVKVTDSFGSEISSIKTIVPPVSSNSFSAGINNKTLYLKGTPNKNFSVVNLAGREVLKVTTNEFGECRADVSKLPSSIYFVKEENSILFVKTAKL